LGEPPEDEFEEDPDDPKVDPRYTGCTDNKLEDNPECYDPEVIKETILALEFQLFVDVAISRVVIDEDLRLFKIGPGRKWSITIFRLPDVVPVGTFNRTVEVCSRDNAHWALRVRVVADERLSGLQGE